MPRRASAAALLVAAVAALALPSVPARAERGIYLDVGKDARPAQYQTVTFSDTAGVRIFLDLGGFGGRAEGLEFHVAFECTTSVSGACIVRRSVDVAAFEPDTSLIALAERKSCDDPCPCENCEGPSHYRLHFRTDRLSTIPSMFRAAVGTLHLRTAAAATPARLWLDIARIWYFGASPLETEPFDVASTNTARVGGISPQGVTRWGVLRRLYR